MQVPDDGGDIEMSAGPSLCFVGHRGDGRHENMLQVADVKGGHSWAERGL